MAGVVEGVDQKRQMRLVRGMRIGDFTFADARALAERGAGGNYWRREFLGLTELAQRQRFASNDGRR